MEKYQFKIEDVIVQTPEGWQDFELRLKRDEDISGLLISSTNNFIFWGSAYTALKQRWDANYNDKVRVSIDILQSDGTYDLEYAGVVILPEVTFHIEKLFAEATIEDANFQGAIQNNKNVKSFLNAGISKNGEQITSPSVINIDYFNAAGVFQGLANRRVYLLKDSLDFLVRFMTDNEVKGIQSAYFDDVSNWGGGGNNIPCITTGISIRLASQDAPNVSFAQCMIFLQRTHDLTFDFVTDTNGDPVMRIEEKAFFFQDTVTDTIRDITDLSVKVDSERIYSHLEVGNNNAFDAGNCSSTTRWFSFQKEDYSLKGKGNIDKLLDLTTDFITDSNVIQDIVVNANESFDEDIVIVIKKNINEARDFVSAKYCSGTSFYNLSFTNDQIIDRQLNSIPNSVAKYLTAATTPSKAELGGNIDVVIPTNSITDINSTNVGFLNEQYDLGNNYDISNPNETFYDVPFTGNFSFEVSLSFAYMVLALNTDDVGQTNLTAANITYGLILERFDSSFTDPAKETISTTGNLVLSGVVGTFVSAIDTLSATMTCDSGDRVRVRITTIITDTNVGDIRLALLTDSVNTFFKCLGAADDAGAFKVFDPNDFKAKVYTFEKNVSLARSANILANTRDSIVINESSDTSLDKTTWVEEVVVNKETGATSFKMIK